MEPLELPIVQVIILLLIPQVLVLILALLVGQFLDPVAFKHLLTLPLKLSLAPLEHYQEIIALFLLFLQMLYVWLNQQILVLGLL